MSSLHLALVLLLGCGTTTQGDTPTLTVDLGSARVETSANETTPPSGASRAATPGRVQCETTTCDLASEVCCITEAEGRSDLVGECVPKPPQPSDGTSPWACRTDVRITQRSCDEAADCAPGRRCCTPNYDESNLFLESCEEECGGERCVVGSTCPNGNACAPMEGSKLGVCPLEVAPPTCGSATCKLGERCCWDAEQGTGSCAAECGDTWFSCTSPEHCAPPYQCNTWPGAIQYRCGGAGFQGGVLCRSTRDCPKYLSAFGTYEGAPEARACEHTEVLPPGLKECIYE